MRWREKKRKDCRVGHEKGGREGGGREGKRTNMGKGVLAKLQGGEGGREGGREGEKHEDMLRQKAERTLDERREGGREGGKEAGGAMHDREEEDRHRGKIKN